MKTTLLTALGAVSAFSMIVGSAHGAAVDDEGMVKCVDLLRIDHTEVVDEQNILFYMRGGDIYLNRLAHPLPGLGRNRPFMYKTSIGRLCNLDTITVLEPWGFGFTQGGTSWLGKFRPTDEASVDALKSGQKGDVELEPVDPD